MRKPKKIILSLENVTESRLFFPLVALCRSSCSSILSLSPVFSPLRIRDGNLHGSLIDIFRNGSTCDAARSA
jgi:hypothetical protein